MRTKAAFVLLVLASGCATYSSQTPTKKTRPLAKERIYNFQTPTSADDVKVTVTRDTAFAGSGCRIGLYFNDKLAADFSVRDTATFYLKPGEYKVGVGMPKSENNFLCPYKDTNQRETVIRPKEEKGFRIMTIYGGGYDILPI